MGGEAADKDPTRHVDRGHHNRHFDRAERVEKSRAHGRKISPLRAFGAAVEMTSEGLQPPGVHTATLIGVGL